MTRQDAPPLVLGTAQWGMDYGIANHRGQPPRDEVAALLDVARREGIDTLDTARAYGASEEVIGALIEGDAYWTVVTKLSPDVTEAASRDAALERLDESLARSRAALGRERLDLLLLHRAAGRTAWGGALWKRLCELRDEGSLGALGVSVATPTEALKLLDDPTLDALQVAASLFDQRLLRAGFFERAEALGKRVFLRSVFLQGVAHLDPPQLTGSLRSLGPALRRTERWARVRGLRAADAFLLYARDVLGRACVVGCEHRDQLEHNLSVWHSTARATAALRELAAEISIPDERVLDPQRWRDLSTQERRANASCSRPSDSRPSGTAIRLK